MWGCGEGPGVGRDPNAPVASPSAPRDCPRAGAPPRAARRRPPPSSRSPPSRHSPAPSPSCPAERGRGGGVRGRSGREGRGRRPPGSSRLVCVTSLSVLRASRIRPRSRSRLVTFARSWFTCWYIWCVGSRLPATSSCASSVSTCVARSWRWRRVVSSADFASASSRTSWSIRSSFSSNSSSIWAAVSSAPDGLGSGTSSSLVRAWSGEWW